MNNSNNGLAGCILRVDLTTKIMSTEPTTKYAERFIGGRAVNSLILLNEMSTETKWSDPENILIFGAGSLLGTMAPGACRVSIEAKNVYNDGKGSANFGGHFGPELKYAGFDHVVITGRADKPVYLWLHDGEAEIRDAGSFWGKTTYQTEAMLRKELGDQRVEVASIGPAGENMVRGSGVYTNPGKVAGGSGVGCVMGSKKLKAIAVRGHGAVTVADPARFMAAVNEAIVKVEASPYVDGWRKSALEGMYLPESPAWNVTGPVRNGQDEYWPLAKRERLVGLQSGVPSYKRGMASCFACPAGCMPFYCIESGEYCGTKGIGYWINSVYYSIRLDLDDPAASLAFHLLSNQLGLDGDMAAVVLSWAFECFEKGLLTRKDTDGLILKWGDADIILTMLKKLAYREGIGNLLGDGVKEASRRLGKGSEEFAIHMKGQDSVDPYRTRKGYAFGVSLSPVAGRHLRGALTTPAISGPPDLEWHATGYDNVPEAVFWQAQAKEIEDMIGICAFVGTWSGIHALEVQDYIELISSAMGIDLSEEELMTIARRGINLEKAFNTIHTDLGRENDYPPPRYIKEPIKSGPYAGFRCDKEKWDEMLDRYYELNGWDKETGLPTYQSLIQLGLEDAAVKLGKRSC